MRRLVFGLFLLLALLILRPILPNVWYPMHDNTQVTRTYLLESTLRAGQFPAIWAQELDEGGGYPLFHFYAPLFYYFTLLPSLLVGSYFVGLKFALFVSTVLGMIGTYTLARRWGRGAGVVSAVSYGLLPYAAVNLYVRGAFAEYLAMGLLPWVFYAWENLTSRRQQLIAGVFTALFILSHNLIPLLTIPFLLVWILLHHRRALKRLLLPATIALGLSAFFFIPLIFERQFVQADQIAVTTDYSLHFVAPSQLWNSLWGYGGSAAGVEDGISFKVGKLHLILAALGFVLAMSRRRSLPIILGLSALLALFMTTQYSAVLWDNYPGLPLIQFPWRFLVVAGLFVSLLAGYSVTIFRNLLFQLPFVLLAISALLILNLKLFVPQQTFPAQLDQFTNPAFLATIPQIISEFSPVWLSRDNPSPADATVLPYNYYPTWKVLIDGISVPTFPSGAGALAVLNPTQSTNITAIQSHTPLENFATIISTISVVTVLILFIRQPHVQT